MAIEDWDVKVRNKVWDLLSQVFTERKAQNIKWGKQSWPDGTFDTDEARWQRDFDRNLCEDAAKDGTLTWRHILQEEISEAFAETDWDKLSKELIQVAAVCLAWVEDGEDNRE